jgi:hypothetical protein
MEQKEEVERWPQLKKKKRRSLSVERAVSWLRGKSSPKAKAKPAPRGRSPGYRDEVVPLQASPKQSAPPPAPPAAAPAPTAAPAASDDDDWGSAPTSPPTPAPAPPAPPTPLAVRPPAVTPAARPAPPPPPPPPPAAAAARPPAAKPAAAAPAARPAPVPKPAAAAAAAAPKPPREGSFRLVHRDKVRNTTLAFKGPKLGFTLGLWKDGWIRVQRVAQTCPHFLALAPGDALIEINGAKVQVPLPRDQFAGLLRKLSTAPRPLELTFVRVLDDAPRPPATSPEFASLADPPTPSVDAGGPPFASPPAVAAAPPPPRAASPSDPRAPEPPTPPASPPHTESDIDEPGGLSGPTPDIQPAALRRAAEAQRAAARPVPETETLDFFNWLSGEKDAPTPSKAGA